MEHDRDAKPVTLPCGHLAFWTGTGYACTGCLTVYGSAGCACTSRANATRSPYDMSGLKEFPGD